MSEVKITYRLLTPEDKIEATDEHLMDDCQSWCGIKTGWPIGMPYSRNFYQPMRRIVITPTNQAPDVAQNAEVSREEG